MGRVKPKKSKRARPPRPASSWAEMPAVMLQRGESGAGQHPVALSHPIGGQPITLGAEAAEDLQSNLADAILDFQARHGRAPDMLELLAAEAEAEGRDLGELLDETIALLDTSGEAVEVLPTLRTARDLGYFITPDASAERQAEWTAVLARHIDADPRLRRARPLDALRACSAAGRDSRRGASPIIGRAVHAALLRA